MHDIGLSEVVVELGEHVCFVGWYQTDAGDELVD